MLTFRRNTLALLVLLCSPAVATDYIVEYGGGPPPAPISGQLNDDMFLGDVDPIFHRPYFDESCIDALNSGDYRYDTITLINSGSGEADVNVEIDCGTHYCVIYGYAGGFFPDDPIANCFIADDNDGPNGWTNVDTTLVSNQVVVFVVTSNGPNQAWPWTAKFSDHLFFDGFGEALYD